MGLNNQDGKHHNIEIGLHRNTLIKRGERILGNDPNSTYKAILLLSSECSCWRANRDVSTEAQIFLAGTICRVSAGAVTAAIRDQLSEWWGPDLVVSNEQRIDFLSKTINPESECVQVFEFDGAPQLTLIDTNLRDGYSSLMHCLSLSFAEDVFYSLRSSAEQDPSPIHELKVRKAGKPIRVVRSMMESSGWNFFERGASLDFETPASYKAKRIRDRVTRDLLIDYFRRIGCDLASVPSERMSRSGAIFCNRRLQHHP